MGRIILPIQVSYITFYYYASFYCYSFLLFLHNTMHASCQVCKSYNKQLVSKSCLVRAMSLAIVCYPFSRLMLPVGSLVTALVLVVLCQPTPESGLMVDLRSLHGWAATVPMLNSDSFCDGVCQGAVAAPIGICD